MKRLISISILSIILLPVNKAQQDTTIVPPDLNYVTVMNEEGHVLINWSYSEPDSVDGFIVYYYDPTKTPSPGIPFDTINPYTTSFVDESGMANNYSVPYTVAAFKKISGKVNRSPQTPPHYTIYLEPAWEECTRTIYLNWSPYVGWGSQLSTYNIYENNVLISSSPDTFFVHTNLQDNQIYQYRVVAEHTGGILSNSNSRTRETAFPLPADHMNADYATVEDNAINLGFSIGDNGDEYEYVLVSKPPSSAFFSDTLTVFSYSRQMDYRYLVADVSEQYQFKLISKDRCNRFVDESNISSNIVLQGDRNENVVNLNWSEYVDWLGGVEHYKLYRSEGVAYQEIGETTGLSFQDDISNINNNQTAVIRYYVQASEGSSNPYKIQGLSRSNVLEIFLESLLIFPTAFTPNSDGMNDVFHPIELNFVPTNYFLAVFDRWGKKVFETKQIDERWDGKFSSGKGVSEGVYHYYVTYNDAAGKERSQTGTVTVLYP